MKLEDNFEKLKNKMLQKRAGRQYVNDDTDENVNENTGNVINSSDDINVNEYVCTDKNTCENNDENSDANTNVNVDTNVSTNANVNTNNCVNNSVNKNVNITNPENCNVRSNIFILKVERKEESVKRQTYYLKGATIEKIDRISESSGIGKSELVQRILEEALNKIKIIRD